jgi:ubiquinone/menaquinone biosynthesis C-methylase UbiE
MQYINWDEMQDKEEPEFDKVIKVYDRFELSNIMRFQYHWNEEVLAQFHATYFYDQSSDEIH